MSTDATPIIKISNLTKKFRVGFFRKEVRAVQNLSLEVKQGEIFGFLGPNGAGKTTTIKMLTGLIFPTSGKAELFSLPVRDLRAKKRVGFLPDHPYFTNISQAFNFSIFTAVYSEYLDLSGKLASIVYWNKWAYPMPMTSHCVNIQKG